MLSKKQPILFGALVFAAQATGSLCQAAPPGYERDTRSYNLAHGRVVFAEKCMRCHESGRKGAPVFGDMNDWLDRVEQPLDTLIQHALLGHGRMPARGGQDITDQDVAAAVAYVVNRVRVISAGQGALPPAPPNDEPKPLGGDSPDHAVVQMFLMLVGKDRWK
jgi:cytochrome c5